MGSRKVSLWAFLLTSVLVWGCHESDSPPAKPAASNNKTATARATGSSLATLIARASSVQLAKVVEIEDVDERPSDGDHNRRFTFEILQSSGTPVRTLDVPIAYGGYREGPYPSLPTRTHMNSLRLGEKHWFLMGSDSDATQYPYPVVAWWPDGKAPRQITDLVSEDAFRWRPIYHAHSGLTYGFDVLSPARWKVIIKRDGVFVWEREIEGAFVSANEMNVPGGANSAMDPIDAPDAKNYPYLIYPVTRVTLGDGNRFDVPPGEYRVRYGREFAGGKLLAEWALPANSPNDPLALRQFSRPDGTLMLTARIEFLAAGGVAVGSESESWLRKIVKRHDADGVVTETEVFRHGSVKDENGQHSHNGWIPIDPNGGRGD